MASAASDYLLAGQPTIVPVAGTINALSSYTLPPGTIAWSTPSSWVGSTLPSNGDILSISIPSSSIATYDASAPSMVLQSLSNAGNFVLASSNLSIGSFNQSAGTTTGTGNLNVTSNFTETGGTITLTGATANIVQATGPLNIFNLTAPTVNLTASNGAITQSGPIVASTLTTLSLSGTTLTNSGNQIGSFSGTNTGVGASGDIALSNSAPLTISSIVNTGGSINVTNTGGMTIAGAIAATGSGTVSLTESSGAITEGGSGLIDASGVLLTAATGIGSFSTPLQLVTSSLSANSTSSTSGGIYITNTPTAAVTLNSLINAGLNAPITYSQNGQDLTIAGSVTSQGGSVLIDPPTNLIMSPTASITSIGGSIGVQSSGSVVLSSISAGPTGAINLSAGGSVSVAPGSPTPNLTAGTATLAAGGNVDFSAQVQTLIATGVLGSYTITDAAGAVLFSGSGTAPTTVQQLITTVLPPANNTSGTSSGTSIISLITNNVLIGGTTDTGLLNLLYATSPSIGGIVGTFGGSDFSTLTTTESGQTGSTDLQGSGASGSGTGTSGSGGGIDNSKGKPNAKPNKC